MESEEAIMENENNSNLESESNTRERDQHLPLDELEVSGDLSNEAPKPPDHPCIVAANSYDDEENNSEDLFVNDVGDINSSITRQFTGENYSDQMDTFEPEQPTESIPGPGEQLAEDVLSSAEQYAQNKHSPCEQLTEELLAPASTSDIAEHEDQDYERLLSEGEGNLQPGHPKSVGNSPIASDTEELKESSPYHNSHTGENTNTINHIGGNIEDYTAHKSEIQSVDFVEEMQSAAASAQGEGSVEQLNLNENPNQELNNFEPDPDMPVIDQFETFKGTGKSPNTSNYWDDDVDLLDDYSKVSGIDNKSSTEFELLADDKSIPLASGDQDVNSKNILDMDNSSDVQEILSDNKVIRMSKDSMDSSGTNVDSQCLLDSVPTYLMPEADKYVDDRMDSVDQLPDALEFDGSNKEKMPQSSSSSPVPLSENVDDGEGGEWAEEAALCLQRSDEEDNEMVAISDKTLTDKSNVNILAFGGGSIQEVPSVDALIDDSMQDIPKADGTGTVLASDAELNLDSLPDSDIEQTGQPVQVTDPNRNGSVESIIAPQDVPDDRPVDVLLDASSDITASHSIISTTYQPDSIFQSDHITSSSAPSEQSCQVEAHAETDSPCQEDISREEPMEVTTETGDEGITSFITSTPVHRPLLDFKDTDALIDNCHSVTEDSVEVPSEVEDTVSAEQQAEHEVPLQKPAIEEMEQSSLINDEQLSVINDDHLSDIKDKQPSDINDEQSSLINNEHSSLVEDQQSSHVSDEQFSLVNDDQSSVMNDDLLPSCVKNEHPSHGDEHLSLINDNEQSSCISDKQPSCADEQSSCIKDEPSSLVTDKQSSLIKEDDQQSHVNEESSVVNDDQSSLKNDEHSSLMDKDELSFINDEKASHSEEQSSPSLCKPTEAPSSVSVTQTETNAIKSENETNRSVYESSNPPLEFLSATLAEKEHPTASLNEKDHESMEIADAVDSSNNTPLSNNISETQLQAEVTETKETKLEPADNNTRKPRKSSRNQIKIESVSSMNLRKENSVNVKKESISGHGVDVNEDVMVVDDEGKAVPVKNETEVANVTKNGPDVRYSRRKQKQQESFGKSASSAASEALSTEITTTESPKSKSKSKMQTCLVCKKICKCKYNIVRNGDVKHLCDDSCFKQFRKTPSMFLKGADESNPLKTSVEAEAVSKEKDSLVIPQREVQTKQSAYKTCAVCQLMNLNTVQPFCNWKGLDFCGESCLGKFQANLNASCSYCHAYIPFDMRATCCLKIANDIRPFCKQKCYNEFKKKLRLCSFCQRDVAGVAGAFTAMVGSGGKFKEFCSQACMKKLESQLEEIEVIISEKTGLKQEAITCSVCGKRAALKYTAWVKGRVNKICSDMCFSAFRYTNSITNDKCDKCGTMCSPEEVQSHFVQYEGQLRHFCSDTCVSFFRKNNSKVVQCVWCGTKKLNFDMIERLEGDNTIQMFCSLNCMSLFRVSLQAKISHAVSCDQCHKVVSAQYHLTMSDASIRDFCSYACVIAFQSQFTAKHAPSPVSAPVGPVVARPATIPPLLPAPPAAQPQQQKTPATRGSQGRMNTRQASAKQQSSSFPIISNVVSLAQPGAEEQSSAPVPPNVPTTSTLPTATGNLVPSADGKHQILIQEPPPKTGKNKALQCRPVTQTKGTSCKPHSQNKEIQTDDIPVKIVMMPVPVPIYIPMPSVMFTAPAPKLVPFPIPIPVPIFIPTTKKSVGGICKAIQDIVERMPSDPLEAELLMMAEAVAADKRPGDSDSDSEASMGPEDFGGPGEDEVMRPMPREDESLMMRRREGQGEEDMIQMALRMAEEMSGPIEDLETSVEPVAVSTEAPQTQHHHQLYDSQVDDDYIPSRSRTTKRPGRARQPSSRAKRQRVDRSYNEDDSMQSEASGQAQSMDPPPDANYHLKFTYGVNAWRHWVINKNAQIEKTKNLTGSHRLRSFSTDILKCTTDELNITLCLFIKEVRKPNGDEYSPDSIYYLCLGIQQFLYENGRIDNIFTDSYFDKFTDCLNDILKTLQPKINSQGQMLCRIEEEHLWESKQLGAHSPFVLLNTLIYFHTKHFILKNAQEHMALSFAQILKHWKKGVAIKGQSTVGGKNVSLRFYCLANGKKDGLAARKSKDGVPVYEVTENFDNPLRCPVKLYEFFLSKCPESIKNRNDIFYPVPERSCVPDSPVWYSTQSIDVHTMDKMLTRVLLVREIQEAHLHAQPIYL